MQSVNMTPLLLQVLYEYKKNNETAMERFGEFLTSNALEKHVYDFSTFEIDNDLETNNVQQVTLQACYNSKYLTSKTGLFCVLANSLYLFAIENGSYRCWKICTIDDNGNAVKDGQPIDTLETGTVNDLRSQYFGVADTTSSVPVASETVLGGIKVGDNLAVTADGTLSVPTIGSTVASADFDSTKTQLNGLNIDGTIYKFLDVKVNDGSNLIIGKNREIEAQYKDAVSIGNSSSILTSGHQSTSIGCDCASAGTYTVAIGYGAIANSYGATVVGYQANASGNNSSSYGYQANASGIQSISIGDNSITSSAASISIGTNSKSTGINCICIGASSKSSSTSSIAIGRHSVSSVPYEHSIITTENPKTTSSIFTCCDIDHVFFANLEDNETAYVSYTSFSQFTKGHYLKEYLGCGEVTAVTETMANIIANTSDYFDTTGSGTSADPYVVTPKTLDSQPHAGRLYKIALTATGKYITFQSSNNEKCIVEFTGTTSSTDVLAFKNISGKARHGVNFLGGANGYTLNIPINTAFVADIDINSPDMWQLSD